MLTECSFQGFYWDKWVWLTKNYVSWLRVFFRIIQLVSILIYCRRCGRLVVSAPDSRSNGPRVNHGWGWCIVFFYSHSAFLHPCVNGLANLMLGLTLGWTSIPSMGEVEFFCCSFMLYKPELSVNLMATLNWLVNTEFTFTFPWLLLESNLCS